MTDVFLVEVLRGGVWKQDINAINVLVSQLLADVGSNKRNSHNFLTISLLQNTATIMVVRDGVNIMGLGVFNEKSTLTRKIGWIDDLVVDENFRRRGIGETLIRTMIEAGKERKLERLNTTCRPEKIAANNLCLKAGFKFVGTINGTNFYTFEYGS